jgi:hypothetical protein
MNQDAAFAQAFLDICGMVLHLYLPDMHDPAESE